jgi:hypothetical protein
MSRTTSVSNHEAAGSGRSPESPVSASSTSVSSTSVSGTSVSWTSVVVRALRRAGDQRDEDERAQGDLRSKECSAAAVALAHRA